LAKKASNTIAGLIMDNSDKILMMVLARRLERPTY
jgi:hypothetical protein